MIYLMSIHPCHFVKPIVDMLLQDKLTTIFFADTPFF